MTELPKVVTVKRRTLVLLMWLVTASLIVSVIAGINSVVYADKVGRDSEHNWCSLIDTLDKAYQSQHPTSPVGQEIARNIHDLKRSLGC